MSNDAAGDYYARMVTRAEILWLAVSSGVAGALIGGLMLGVGMDLLANGQPLGLLLIIPGAPAGAIIGWWQGKKLARQLDP